MGVDGFLVSFYGILYQWVESKGGGQCIFSKLNCSAYKRLWIQVCFCVDRFSGIGIRGGGVEVKSRRSGEMG
jgi:hypothetical protein